MENNRREMLQLRFLGKDSWGRQVFEDQDGRLWKNTELLTHQVVRLCTVLNNEFDREPDTPMDIMEQYKNVEIVFLPKDSAGH